MIERIAKVLRMQKPAIEPDGLLFASGTDVPSGVYGYQTGCIFQKIDGGVGTALYVNEGDVDSCSFNALESGAIDELQSMADVHNVTYGSGKIIVADGSQYNEVAVSGKATLASSGAVDIPLLDATAGTASVSKAVISGADKGITGLGPTQITSAPLDYTTPSFVVGGYSTPLVETSTDDNIAASIHLTTATNKANPDQSTMALFVGCGNTAATTNNHMQGILASTTLGGNCFDAYAVQGHITINTEMSTQNANAHITGLSGKALLTANNDVGWVTGVLAIVDGTGTTGGLCHVVAAQVESTTTSGQVDAVYYAGANQTVATVLTVSGTSNLASLLTTDSATAGFVHAKDLVPTAAPDATKMGASACLAVNINGTPYYIPLYATLHV